MKGLSCRVHGRSCHCACRNNNRPLNSRYRFVSPPKTGRHSKCEMCCCGRPAFVAMKDSAHGHQRAFSVCREHLAGHHGGLQDYVDSQTKVMGEVLDKLFRGLSKRDREKVAKSVAAALAEADAK